MCVFVCAEFCSSLEDDVRERAERRRERETVSKEWKKKGATAFKRGEVREALDCYTAALKETPWLTMLYTNRALVSLHTPLTHHIHPSHTSHTPDTPHIPHIPHTHHE